ncbi:Ribonucleases P/MRP protein subunit pop1 [Cyphellophora attinorum]|uniref:Ribonucleases P/MRP protein subunit pop1 n=1 Tax=Cyphellophora attinorum TaxID=1664694 RepID=A0A0N1NZQ7_9EURO|nr:Ribonucleases P/MRP protein subunit pop1 [Phialophora attinorum]KPI41386.1 Ribonucleases P/MRP protein subunit pop1 [Phialophora attinorum]
MAPGTPDATAGRKRRADAASLTSRGGGPKRFKPEIAVQRPPPTNTSSNNANEINVANFVKAREFEINAIERNMKAMRKTLSSRAFQQLPRHMRRRTASHNVKKVPKRSRRRAVREMRDDNTPTVSKRAKTPTRKMRLRLETARGLQRANQRAKVARRKKKEKEESEQSAKPKPKPKNKDKDQDPEKQVSIARIPKIKKNTLAKPPTATSKYKRRQVNKTWLPTHLWHAKRAHMTRPTEPLWRLAIPLRPTEKSYRPTHYASNSRGCVAWDMSYMSTVACVGTEHTLMNMLVALKFGADKNSGRLRRWKAGTRFAEGFVHTVEKGRLLGPATVLWAPGSEKPSQGLEEPDAQAKDETKSKRQKVKLDRKLLVQVHPSIFKEFWIELLRAAKMQKPQVLVEDLRFEIGSIQVMGPASKEALLAVLRQRHEPTEEDIALKTWKSLAGLSNPASLPQRAVLSFDIIDPRLDHPPKQIKMPTDQVSIDRLNEMLAEWPMDEARSTMNLMSYKARWLTSTKLPSQKAINRRQAAAGPGQPIAVIEKDPAIPIILIAHRPASTVPNTQGSWTVLLPWCAVDAVWRSLQYCPISTGRTPRFGGLEQTRQIAFEQSTPWFPADMPGTEAGKAWERTESEKRFDKWVRRPPSRRLRWDLVDIGLGRLGELGRGWACDWEYLFKDTKAKAEAESSTADPTAPPEAVAAKDSDVEMTEQPAERSRRRNTSSPETSPEPEDKVKTTPEPDVDYIQLTPDKAATLLKPRKFKSKSKAESDDTPAIATVRIRLLTKGTPEAGARVYRLPKLPLPPKPDAGMAPPTTKSPIRPATEGSGRDDSSSNPSGSLPASAEVHTSTLPAAISSSADLPPGAQPPPPSPSSAFSSLPQQPKSSSPSTLREKWLSLVPPSLYTSSAKTPSRNSTLQPSSKKPQPNDTNPHHVHSLRKEEHNLSLINVFPLRAPQEIIDKMNTYPSDAQVAEHEARMRLEELLKNDAVEMSKDGKTVKWDAAKGLVECPDKEDLVGFVTSGGYNLVEGRGTGVAGVWVQRVRQGWAEEDKETSAADNAQSDPSTSATSGSGGPSGLSGSAPTGSSGKKGHSSQSKGAEKQNGKPKSSNDGSVSAAAIQRERQIKERTLCIVRNAGSGVGRLGWWEVCE